MVATSDSNVSKSNSHNGSLGNKSSTGSVTANGNIIDGELSKDTV